MTSSSLLKELIRLAENLEYDEINKTLKRLTLPRRHASLAKRLRTGATGYRILAFAELIQSRGEKAASIILRELGAEALVIEVVSDEEKNMKERAEALFTASQNYKLAANMSENLKDKKIKFVYDDKKVIVFEYDNKKRKALREKARDIDRISKVSKIVTPVKIIKEKIASSSKYRTAEVSKNLLLAIEKLSKEKFNQLYWLFFERGKGVHVRLQRSDYKINNNIKKYFSVIVNLSLNGVQKEKDIKVRFIEPEDVTLDLIITVREKLYKKKRK